MKAAIYDPYLDTLGGGERYCLTVAECLLAKGWKIDLFWDEKPIIKKSMERFGLKLENVQIIGKKPIQLSFLERMAITRQYDLIFWLSDGSIPLLFGKKNFLHFQAPFVNIRSKNLISKIKLKFIDQIICNSEFTKSFIDQNFKVKSIVLYPPVDVDKFIPRKKENIILAVGRFEQTMQVKRQDILIEAFKTMCDKGLRDWQLVLIGASLKKPEENQYLKSLKKKAYGYPIKFIANAPFNVLKAYYEKAKIFWHAAGYGIDEEKEPEKVEHFGISPVEAMAAGCVPVVIAKGGQKEIVTEGVNGFCWLNKEELILKTLKIIKNQKLFKKVSLESIKKSKDFSKKKFCERIYSLTS